MKKLMKSGSKRGVKFQIEITWEGQEGQNPEAGEKVLGPYYMESEEEIEQLVGGFEYELKKTLPFVNVSLTYLEGKAN